MYRNKSITITARVLGLLLAVFVVSCEPESFEVDSDDPRDNITDIWSVTEYSQLDTISYPSEITKHPTDSTRIRINYFYGLGYDINAIALLDERRIIIPLQTLDGIDVEGDGTINFSYSQITFNYTADDGSGFVDQVRAEYRRD